MNFDLYIVCCLPHLYYIYSMFIAPLPLLYPPSPYHCFVQLLLTIYMPKTLYNFQSAMVLIISSLLSRQPQNIHICTLLLVMFYTDTILSIFTFIYDISLLLFLPDIYVSCEYMTVSYCLLFQLTYDCVLLSLISIDI